MLTFVCCGGASSFSSSAPVAGEKNDTTPAALTTTFSVGSISAPCFSASATVVAPALLVVRLYENRSPVQSLFTTRLALFFGGCAPAGADCTRTICALHSVSRTEPTSRLTGPLTLASGGFAAAAPARRRWTKCRRSAIPFSGAGIAGGWRGQPAAMRGVRHGARAAQHGVYAIIIVMIILIYSTYICVL